jgi:hypothetical protein
MRYLHLSPGQRAINNWRNKRNRLVQKILNEDRTITRIDALKKANRLMGRMPEGDKKYRNWK